MHNSRKLDCPYTKLIPVYIEDLEGRVLELRSKGIKLLVAWAISTLLIVLVRGHIDWEIKQQHKKK